MSNRTSKKAQTVDAFIERLDRRWREAVAELRAAMLKADGGITEHIKWNAPSFCFSGDDRVTLRFPPKGGLQIILHRGAKAKDATSFAFDDPTGRVTWAAADRGVVSFAEPDVLVAEVDAIVKLALRWMHATVD